MESCIKHAILFVAVVDCLSCLCDSIVVENRSIYFQSMIFVVIRCPLNCENFINAGCGFYDDFG